MPGLAHPFTPLTGPSLDNRRIGAALIDGAVIAVIVLLLRALTGTFGAITLMLALAWAMYYFFAFEWGAEGQTIGKRLMHLRVLREDGERPGVREVALRTVLRIVDGIGFYVVGLGAMLATGERRQRLGDLVAGTVVTTADPSPPAQPEQPEPDVAPVQPLPYEPESKPEPEPELPPAATVEMPTPPIADAPKATPPPVPPVADTSPEPPAQHPDVPVPPPPPPPLEPKVAVAPPPPAKPEPPAQHPDVPVPPPPPPPLEPEAPKVRTESIEVTPAIDLVMEEDDEDAGPGSTA